MNGVAVTADRVMPMHIGVREGKVTALVDDRRDLHAEEQVDARGMLIFPGLIDPHCHFWDPGQTHREDWATGTKAAAAGGITTVIEMPLSGPPTIDARAFDAKTQRASALSFVDYALWGGILPADTVTLEARVLELVDRGVVGFKAFMCRSAPEFPPINDGQLLAACEVMSRHKQLLALHCENGAIVDHKEEELQTRGRKDPQAFLESRPEIAEYEAIQRAVLFAERTGTTLYIVHMSLPPRASVIRAARTRGARIYVESAPRYLVLDELDMRAKGPFVKCSPPLRSSARQSELWDAVLNGSVDTLGTDHSTYTNDEKAAGDNDIWRAPNGLPDIQTAFSLVLSEGVHRRGMSLTQLASLMSSNASRIFGLYPRKGVIAVGSDADLTLVDPNAQWTIRDDDMFYKHRWTPYDGKKVQGKVVRTLVRGRTVFHAGEICGREGYGEHVRASRSSRTGDKSDFGLGSPPR